jgi:hypothetical protein
MERRQDEGRFSTKMEMFTMDNGTKGKSTALGVMLSTKTIVFMKDFGRKASTAVKRLRRSLFLFNFFDFNNYLLSIILLILILFLLSLLLFLLALLAADNIPVFINVISRNHLSEVLILVVLAISLLSLSHVVYQEIINLFNYVLA